MLTYTICSLDALLGTALSFNATHVVSLIDPDMDNPRITGLARPQHLVLHLNDLDRVDHLPGDPSPAHVAALLTFAGKLDDKARVLFHCVAGRRRSTAAALICDLAIARSSGVALDQDHLVAAAGRLRQIRPGADPNRALLTLADDALGLGGLLRDLPFPRVLDLSTD